MTKKRKYKRKFSSARAGTLWTYDHNNYDVSSLKLYSSVFGAKDYKKEIIMPSHTSIYDDVPIIMKLGIQFHYLGCYERILIAEPGQKAAFGWIRQKIADKYLDFCS